MLTQCVELYIPATVFQECAGEDIRKRHPDALDIWKLAEQKKIHVTALGKRKRMKGEEEAIVLFKEIQADLFLCDDGRAIKLCRVLRIPFTTCPRVVLDLFHSGLIDLNKAQEALNKLEILGRYSKGIISNALLELIQKRR